LRTGCLDWDLGQWTVFISHYENMQKWIKNYESRGLRFSCMNVTCS